MSEKQNASDTVTVLPPSPYGICFDLKTDRFQLEEATRSCLLLRRMNMTFRTMSR